MPWWMSLREVVGKLPCTELYGYHRRRGLLKHLDMLRKLHIKYDGSRAFAPSGSSKGLQLLSIESISIASHR